MSATVQQPVQSGELSESSKYLRQFADLKKAVEQQHFERVLDISPRLLKVRPDDVLVMKITVIALIGVGKYSDALGFIDLQSKEFAKTMAFQRAYCLYKLQRYEDAKEQLEGLTNDEYDMDVLRGQVFYKSGNYEDAINVLEKVLKRIAKESDEYFGEVVTNYYAAVASRLNSQPNAKSDLLVLNPKKTFEIVYNHGCVCLSEGKLDEAFELLNQSKLLCEQTLEAEGFPKELVANELAPIMTQLAYVLMLRGDQKRSLEVYNDVISLKSSDFGSVVIAISNLLSSLPKEDIVNRMKELKWKILLKRPDLASKLTLKQYHDLIVNHILFLIAGKRFVLAGREADSFINNGNESEELLVMKYVAMMMEKKEAVVVAELKENVYSKKKSVLLTLYLAQIYANTGKLEDAANLLKKEFLSVEPNSEYEPYWKPSIVSVQVNLYRQMEQLAEAKELLQNAIKIHQKRKSACLNDLKRAYGFFMIQVMNSGEGVLDIFSELVRNDPSDSKALAGLVIVSAMAKDGSASQYHEHLLKRKPTPNQEKAELIKSDNLEEIWTLNKNNVTAMDVEEKKKRKRVRKLKKPLQNYDPEKQPNQERWLPKHLRSDYKKTNGKKKAKFSGAQGATAEEQSTQKQSNTSKKKQQQGKKKKGKGKW